MSHVCTAFLTPLIQHVQISISALQNIGENRKNCIFWTYVVIKSPLQYISTSVCSVFQEINAASANHDPENNVWTLKWSGFHWEHYSNYRVIKYCSSFSDLFLPFRLLFIHLFSHKAVLQRRLRPQWNPLVKIRILKERRDRKEKKTHMHCLLYTLYTKCILWRVFCCRLF